LTQGFQSGYKNCGKSFRIQVISQ